MTDAEKTRTSWEDLPEELHRECARVLGGAIIAAVSQVGGFSPGSADRVVTEHGRRAFVDVEGLLRTHEVFDGADPEHIDAVLAGMTGGWFDKARQPAPPNMPTLRAFQRREALTGLDWLRERWG